MVVERPWGKFEVFLDEPEYKVKRITVDPYQQFSLQYHLHRDEYWTVVEGSGKMIINGTENLVIPGSFWFIPKKAIHRAAASSEGLVFIEVQRGKCDEEDIFRLHDDYGRLTQR